MSTPNGLYCRATYTFPPERQHLQPEKAYDILIQVIKAFSQLQFQWAPIFRPKHGELIIIFQKTDDIADDGYSWGSKGVKTQINLQSRIVEIVQNDDGYILGEKYVSMTKRRYKILINPESHAQLLHYVAVDTNNIKIPVKPPVFFTKPMIHPQTFISPNPASRLYRPAGGSSFTPTSAMMNSPSMAKISTQKPHLPSLYNPSAMKKPTLSNTPMSSSAANALKKKKKMVNDVHDQDELSSDEFDSYTIKDLAQARYQRNHDFLAELFSSITAKQYAPNYSESLIDVHKKNSRTLEAQIGVIKEDIESLKAKNSKRLQALENERKKFNDMQNMVLNCQSLEDIESLQKDFEDRTHSKIVNFSFSYPSTRTA